MFELYGEGEGEHGLISSLFHWVSFHSLQTDLTPLSHSHTYTHNKISTTHTNPHLHHKHQTTPHIVMHVHAHTHTHSVKLLYYTHVDTQINEHGTHHTHILTQRMSALTQ